MAATVVQKAFLCWN